MLFVIIIVIVVIGDAKTYELFQKLKDEYGRDLNWLIPFPGDWHILKNFQPVVFKIFGHAGLRSIAQKADVKKALCGCFLSALILKRQMFFSSNVFWQLCD